MVGVITDQQVGPLENRPKLGQLFFKVAAIGIGCRIMSTNAGNGKRGRVVGPGIGKKIGGFDIENNLSHTDNNTNTANPECKFRK